MKGNMKIVILNGSPRANGNTAAMVEMKMSAQLNECHELGKNVK